MKTFTSDNKIVSELILASHVKQSSSGGYTANRRKSHFQKVGKHNNLNNLTLNVNYNMNPDRGAMVKTS